MASKKAEAALAKQKEAKQKKVLFLLVPLFLGLMLAKLWATNRGTPISCAAASKLSVPSVRKRLVCANVRSKFRPKRISESAVA